MNMNTIRLGIIGIGNIGTAHCMCILKGKTPEITLAAVADRSEERREWAGKNLPQGTAIFTEGIEMIHSGVCDSVLIATPHYQHPELAIAAFDNGLHVLCEKPAGVYTLQVREMMQCADAHPSLTFAMMFNQRTSDVHRKMHELIQNKAIGELKRVSWLMTTWYRTQFYYDSGAWRATWAGEGGGVLLNQCPHQLDLLQWLCGMPNTITAFCHEGKWHDIEVEDDVTAYLTYPNGATGIFVTSTGDTPGTNRLEIIGTLGKLVCESGRLTFQQLPTDERIWCRTAAGSFSEPEAQTVPVGLDGENPEHTGVLNAFAAHILYNKPLVADGREGINGLMLSNAMHLSSWLQKTVSLPFDEQLFLDELNKRRGTSRLKESKSVYADLSNTY